jgi:hypothetical protein
MDEPTEAVHEIAGHTFECPKHGTYIGTGIEARRHSPCPVCEGRSTGRSWANSATPTPHESQVDADAWQDAYYDGPPL